MKLLTAGNPKTDKGKDYGYLTVVLHLAPHTMGGRGNVCPWSTPGCRKSCLNTAGRGGIFRKGKRDNAIQKARRARTRLFFDDRAAFLFLLYRDIAEAKRRADRLGLKLAVRLNGTSDIPWERVAPQIFWRFRDVMFYDYTKSLNRCIDAGEGRFPANYDLSYSRTENDKVAPCGVRTIVVADKDTKAKLVARGWVDGDKHDLRFLEASDALVVVKAKGRAVKDRTGFVLREV